MGNGVEIEAKAVKLYFHKNENARKLEDMKMYRKLKENWIGKELDLDLCWRTNLIVQITAGTLKRWMGKCC